MKFDGTSVLSSNRFIPNDNQFPWQPEQRRSTEFFVTFVLYVPFCGSIKWNGTSGICGIETMTNVQALMTSEIPTDKSSERVRFILVSSHYACDMVRKSVSLRLCSW